MFHGTPCSVEEIVWLEDGGKDDIALEGRFMVNNIIYS